MNNLMLAAGTPAAGGSSMIIIIILMFAMMYFMVMRPQKKQQQKHQEMVNQMKKGDAVVTIGGLHGVIDSINQDKKLVVIDCDGVYLTFNLNAIRNVTPKVAPQTQATEETTTTPETETVEETKE